mmetsp:Transcript_18329/g.51339  ORF Transcript_18329/g.51339 Transcript_18329/m.51339 type:complete len:370 (-) Transcript_18329:466-1575(-)
MASSMASPALRTSSTSSVVQRSQQKGGALKARAAPRANPAHKLGNHNACRRGAVKAAAGPEKKAFAAAIEAEEMVNRVPDSLLRDGIDDPNSMRGRFEKAIRDSQNSICAAIEELDGAKFHQDAWTRPGGGGGITRVIEGGNVWEKAGVNVSVVYGSMPPEAYRAATGTDKEIPADAGRVPFFAAGISSVMHPWNPKAPTMHFNYRYFETEPWNGIDSQWWFGGGTDITPSYLFEEDMAHFHGTLKDACDKHDPEYYSKFKKWCDEYFLIKHRGETRGLGGIFFDDQNDRDQEAIFGAPPIPCDPSATPRAFQLLYSSPSLPNVLPHFPPPPGGGGGGVASCPYFLALHYAGQAPRVLASPPRMYFWAL